jgi:small subunit ribosomal protein S21
MIIVDTRKEKSIESALKTFKNKVQKTKLVQELRDRQNYVKPSVKKRTKIQKAIYTQNAKKNGLN